MEPQIRYARTSDDVNVAYTIMGDGNWLVFSSNMWGDLQYYIHNEATRAQVDAFVAAGWRVLRYDGRGMGASDRNVSDFSLATRLRDLEAVTTKAGAERFVLCGYGQGGPTAILYSLRHPERVSHMVLVNSYARGADYYNSNPLARTLASIKSLAEADYEFFTLALANAATAFSDASTGKAQARMMRDSMSWDSAIAYVDGAHAIDLVADLPMVSVHTLVVEDPSGLMTGELNRTLASQIPDAIYTRGDYMTELELFVRSARTPSGRPTDPDPSPFRTILFTDLESHTPLMARLGDEKGREVLREHERRTREALRSHGGSEVKSMGDGFMASFGSAQRALECARAIQAAFAEPVAGEALKVRIGVNAGEPVAEDDDLFGTSVIAAARIASKATGGQVLVADVVRQLVAGKGLLFHDTGEHDLKGLEEPVRLWELRLG